MLVELKKISKAYEKKGEKPVLKELDLQVEQGELLAVMGKSGCGKSTLLNILGGLTRPTNGEYRYQDKPLDVQNVRKMGQFRKENVGFILQDFALLQERTARQNVELALKTRGVAAKEYRTLAMQYLGKLGMEGKAESYPEQMSGGEKQRVAIARALISRPKMILADEPTGALDEENTAVIMRILKKIAEEGTTVILATHDTAVAEICDRTVRISDGRIIENERNF